MIDRIYRPLGWPSPEQVFSPHGAGARAFSDSVDEKIGRTLRRRPDVTSVRTGILTLDPAVDATSAPFAIVCEFERHASPEALKKTHQLAWNFSRAPLLITLDRTRLQVWSCLHVPPRYDYEETPEISELRWDFGDRETVADVTLRTLHWSSLLSGEVFDKYPMYFRQDARADHSLLENLTYVRQRLLDLNLPVDTTHDLLARLIFVQFLFDRKDADGNAALNDQLLHRWAGEGLLSQGYSDLPSLLTSHSDTYRLFRHLNEHFNGDLFPGDVDRQLDAEAEWQREMTLVTPKHLSLLADFVRGDLELRKGQHSLWPLYSFDAIPLEFISSIYEEFVDTDAGVGVHYTPGHLVDYILDAVLPWTGETWDVRVLDPACGSGIFLVKAFMRIIYRWRLAHDGALPPPKLLSQILVRNLCGVDTNEHAVRVASFSLYLAMCDVIDPRRYWEEMRFPVLRGRTLLGEDFFAEDIASRGTGFEDAFDIVVGNAPWEQEPEVSMLAQRWAAEHGWNIPNKDSGTLFLPKAAAAVRPKGRVALLQSANALLFNTTSERFRRKFFATFDVEEITNFSALRFGLFRQSIAPVCAVVMRAAPPSGNPITYICPKPAPLRDCLSRVAIEPEDIVQVSEEAAGEDSMVWSVYVWGGQRDLELIRRLRSKPTLARLRRQGKVAVRKGVVWGNESKRLEFERPMAIYDSTLLSATDFPHFRIEGLTIDSSVLVDSRDSTTIEAFFAPQLLISKSWRVSEARFRALLFEGAKDVAGVICNQSILSVHFKKEGAAWRNAVLAALNSCVAVYFLMLTSGRFSVYRPEVLQRELLDVPLPEQHQISELVRSTSEADRQMFSALGITQVERWLVEDLFCYRLPYFRKREGVARRAVASTRYRGRVQKEGSVLEQYIEAVFAVLDAAFGQAGRVGVTILRAEVDWELPVQVVALHFGVAWRERVRVETVSSSEFYSRLGALYDSILRPTESSGIMFHRVAFSYDVVWGTDVRVPTVIVIKPNDERFWLPSIGLADGDRIVADLIQWWSGEETSEEASELGSRDA